MESSVDTRVLIHGKLDNSEVVLVMFTSSNGRVDESIEVDVTGDAVEVLAASVKVSKPDQTLDDSRVVVPSMIEMSVLVSEDTAVVVSKNVLSSSELVVLISVLSMLEIDVWEIVLPANQDQRHALRRWSHAYLRPTRLR